MPIKSVEHCWLPVLWTAVADRSGQRLNRGSTLLFRGHYFSIFLLEKRSGQRLHKGSTLLITKDQFVSSGIFWWAACFLTICACCRVVQSWNCIYVCLCVSSYTMFPGSNCTEHLHRIKSYFLRSERLFSPFWKTNLKQRIAKDGSLQSRCIFVAHWSRTE